jgi:hypothetical protein
MIDSPHPPTLKDRNWGHCWPGWVGIVIVESKIEKLMDISVIVFCGRASLLDFGALMPGARRLASETWGFEQLSTILLIDVVLPQSFRAESQLPLFSSLRRLFVPGLNMMSVDDGRNEARKAPVYLGAARCVVHFHTDTLPANQPRLP